MLPVFPLLALLSMVVPSAASPAQQSPPHPGFDEIAHRADTARNADRATEAIGLYRQALQLRPSWSDGWMWLGDLLYEQDRFPEAQDSFAHFVAIAPAPGPALAMKALCEFETRDYAHSAKDFETWMHGGQQGNEALTDVAEFHRAQLLTREGRFDQALDLLGERARRRGESPLLVEAMGLASLRMPNLPGDYRPDLREQVWLAGKATFYLSVREFERGQYFSDRLLAGYGQQPGVHHIRGLLLKAQSKSAEASQEFQKELQISPQNSQATPKLAQARDAAPTSTNAVTSQNPGAFDRLARDAKRALEENRDANAIEAYRQTLQLKPEWDEGLWHLATLLYKNAEYFDACTVLRRFLAQNPGNGYGWAMLGLSEFGSHDYTRALDHLQQGLTLGLGDDRKTITEVRYAVAILLTRSEQFDESMVQLFGLMTDGANQATLIEPFGLAALRMPFLPSEIPPGRRQMIHMAGAATIAIEARKYEDAEKIFADLESRYPDQPGIHFLIGAYLLSAHPSEGIKELKQELAISPENVTARVRLAEEYIKQQSLDEGISLARETLRLAPEEPLAHMVLGEGLIAKGDSVGGIRELEIARDSLPGKVEIRWDLFRAYTAAGRKEDASREKSEIERLSN